MTPAERVRERLQRFLDDDVSSQREFATKVGKSQPWLGKILNGENQLRLDDLDTVAQAMGVPPAELIREAANELIEVTPSELRGVRALRGCDEATRLHVLALVDALAESHAVSAKRLLKSSKQGTITATGRTSHGGATSVPAEIVARLSNIAHSLSELTHELARASTAVAPPDRRAQRRRARKTS